MVEEVIDLIQNKTFNALVLQSDEFKLQRWRAVSPNSQHSADSIDKARLILKAIYAEYGNSFPNIENIASTIRRISADKTFLRPNCNQSRSITCEHISAVVQFWLN
jgi:hypothetical protein